MSKIIEKNTKLKLNSAIADATSNQRGVILFTKTVFLLLFVFVLSACKEDGSVVNNNNSLSYSSIGVSGVCPSNPDNPYDIYGVLHNEGLDYIINNKTYDGNSLDTLVLEIIDNLADFMLLNDPEGKYRTKQEYIDEMSPFVNFSGSIPMSAFCRALYIQLFDISENTNNKINVIRSINDIKIWETNLLNTINANPGFLSELEVKGLLITSSIARHSAVYWLDVSMQGGGLWNFDTHNFDENEEEGEIFEIFGRIARFFQAHWQSITVADAMGAAVGAPAGGIGALVCGIAGSAVEALAQAID